MTPSVSRTLIYSSVLILVALLSACSAKHGDASQSSQPQSAMALGAHKARACMGCHGRNGVSPVSAYPSLAGKKKAYLVAQLQAFRTGERKNPSMNAIARHLSRDDIEQLAGFFAAQQMPEDASE